MKRIDRHPVGAVDKDPLAIHLKQELPAALLIRHAGADQLHGANPMGKVHVVDFVAVLKDTHRHVVEARVALALGPPELGVGDVHIHPPRREQHPLPLGENRVAALSLHFDLVALGIARRLQLAVKVQHQPRRSPNTECL